jgi:hypothetical protein
MMTAAVPAARLTQTKGGTDMNRQTMPVQAKAIEAHGVMGLASKPWRKTFKSTEALCKWAEKNDAVVYATRELEESK